VLTASDGVNTTSGTYSVAVSGVNDAPTGAATAVLAAGTEDTAYTVSAANLLTGFSDVDTGDTLRVSGLTASNGTVIDNANGTFTMTPTANFNGAVALSYNVVDGHGGSVAATRSYTLAAVNDPAIISDDVSTIQDKSVVEAGTGIVGDPNASGKLLVADVDTGEAKFQAPNTVIGTYGDFTFNSNSGAWTYKLRDADANVQALKTGQTVTDTLHVVSFDGTAGNDVIVGIAGSNDSVDVIGTKTLTFDLTGNIWIYNGFDFFARDSYYSATVDWIGTGTQAYNGWAGRYSDMVAATGADFSVDKLDIREYSGAKEVDIKGFNNGVELYNKHVVLTSTMQTVALDYANIDDLQIVVTVGTASSGLYGWWYIDNISVA
jgi:VCBS repeat-containing protein